MFSISAYRRITVAAIAAACPAISCAADFPNRPVRIVVPSGPVGVLDILARQVGPKLSQKWGYTVVVDNRAGANGILGSEIVAKSVPDGHTLLISGPGFATNPSLYKLPYDTLHDFTVITVLGSTPNVLVAHPGLQARSVKELIALAKQSPGKIVYASSGVGSGGHLSMELFKRMAGIDLMHVPYKGAGPATIAVVSGESQLFATAIGVVVPQIKAGQLRALAVTGPERSPALPDVPTAAESGLSGYAVVNSFVFAGPGKMPKPVLDALYRTIVEVLKMQELVSQFHGLDIEIRGTTPDASRAYIASQVKMWEGVMQTANVKRGE
jgi:tripartite-type tricarboxylate transporter receptor subunit TctC